MATDSIRLPGGTRLTNESLVYPTALPGTEGYDESLYAQYSRALWDEQEDALTALHEVWIQNLMFLSDRQWWQRNRDGTWTPRPAPSYKQKPVSNLTLAYFKTALAKATKQRPAWTAATAGNDPEDIQAADLAEKVLEAKWQELRLSRTMRRAMSWVLTTGNCFLYPHWNTRTGQLAPLKTEIEAPIFDPESGAEIGRESVECPCDENGEPVILPNGRPDEEYEGHLVDLGDVAVRVLSPFQVRVTSSAECEEDVTEFQVGEVLTLREIATRYGAELAANVTSEDVGTMEQYDTLLSTLIGSPDTHLTAVGSQRDRELPKALVIHHHEMQTPEFPKGRYWVSASGICLVPPQELPEGFFPCWVHLKELEIPGQYYGGATMSSIVGLNRKYNEVNGQILEHHNLMARGKWLVPRTSGITRDSITTQPGEVIPYNYPFKPEQANIQALPGPVYQERERILADFEMVSGVHRISMGQRPSGVTAGVAIMQLQEADDTDLGPTLAMLEESVAELAGMILKIIQERYREERLVYVAGADRRYQAKSFRGADLKGVLDVRPQTGSAFPWSQVARQEMWMQLFLKAKELFVDPETGMIDKTAFVKGLPLGGLESLREDSDVDVAQALREQEIFEAWTPGAEMPLVNEFQNHEIHYRQGIRLVNSAAFERWPEENKMLFYQHLKEHDVMRQQKRAMAAAQMQMMQPPASAGGDPMAEEPSFEMDAAEDAGPLPSF